LFTALTHKISIFYLLANILYIGVLKRSRTLGTFCNILPETKVFP